MRLNARDEYAGVAPRSRWKPLGNRKPTAASAPSDADGEETHRDQ